MPLDCWWGNVRLAWRTLVARPGFTSLVALTLSLGFGAGAAVFAVADAVLLRSLPYRDPDRLVFLWQTLPAQNVFELEATPADFGAWKAMRSFETIGLIATDSFTLTGASGAERVRGARITSEVLPLLGLTPQRGRAFDASEDDADAAPVAMLSDGLWRRRYGADPGLPGRSIDVNGVAHTIVGVMPPGAMLPGPLAMANELWLPARMTAGERANAISHNYTVIGRLADRVSEQAASGEIDAFATALAARQPNTHRSLGARVVSIAEDTVKGIRPTVQVLIGGVVLLLLITGANVSTLFMVHATGREHDSAVRAALGASRAHLVGLSVVHAMLLSAAGGVAGLFVGRSILRAVLPTIAASLPPSAVATVDIRTASVTLALALLVGVAVGVLTGLSTSSRKPVDALRSGGRTSATSHVTAARNVLVVAQVAFAVMLLAAAGLLIHSIVRLAGVSPGFSAERLLTFRLSLDGDGYQAPHRRTAFVDSLIEKLASAAEVERAAVTSRLPLGGSRGGHVAEIEGRPARPGELRIVDQRHVSPGYFQTMGIRMLRGRGIDARDTAQSEPTVVINRTMADRFWPGRNPIDARVRLSAGFDAGAWFRIVGVVDDVRHVSLSRPAVAEMYRPYAQAPFADMVVAVKTRAQPAAAAPVSRSIVQDLDPNLPLYDVRTMDERIAASFAQLRATMLLLTLTAALAATLAGIAIYGSIWYTVTQRIPEIGLRLALGASRVAICGPVLGRAFKLSGIGAAAGIGGAVAASAALRSLLFETPVTDPATYVLVVATIAVLTAAASIIPARRAIRVDPIVALRSE